MKNSPNISKIAINPFRVRGWMAENGLQKKLFFKIENNSKVRMVNSLVCNSMVCGKKSKKGRFGQKS